MYSSIHLLLTTFFCLLYFSDAALQRNIWIGKKNGQPFWKEGQTFPTSDTEANNVITSMSNYYNLLFLTFDSDSYDNRGSPMNAVIRYDGSDHGCPDAFYDISDSYAGFCPNSSNAVFVGHELTHPIINNKIDASTVLNRALILAEHYCDVFGLVLQAVYSPPQLFNNSRTLGNCSRYGGSNYLYFQGKVGPDDSTRWLLSVSYIGAIRDAWQPSCIGGPMTVNDTNWYCGPSLSRYAHQNTGPGILAFAMLVDGGHKYNGTNILAIGLTKTTHIWWRVLNMYYDASTGYSRFADQLIKACNDLKGTNLRALGSKNLSGNIITDNDCSMVSLATEATGLKGNPLNCGVDSAMHLFQAFSIILFIIIFALK